MLNSRLSRQYLCILNCCFEFTQSRKKDAYFQAGFESRNNLIKVDNSAAILFGCKLRSVGGCFMYPSLTSFASSLVA